MYASDFYNRIGELKKNGKVLTNVVPGCIPEDLELSLEENEDAIAVWYKNPFRTRCYYAGVDSESIVGVLSNAPNGVVLDKAYKESNDELVEICSQSGFELYDTYIRKTYVFKSNPYVVPLEGRRQIMQKLYDPEFGEYATRDDVDDLYEIHLSCFDPLKEDAFTKEQWREIVDEKRCFVFHAKGKVVTYYVFRVEGKKLYSNVSVNLGPANYLYNIERRIFEFFWEKGINIRYAWYSKQNTKALSRSISEDSEAVKSYGVMYNDIFIKR